MRILNPFSVYIPTQVYFGEGRVEKELASIVKRFPSKRILLVTDSGLVKTGLIDSILDVLASCELAIEVFAEVEPDPSVDTIHRVADMYKGCGADLLLAVGGGSSMDTAKGARVVVTQGGHIRDYSGLNAKPVTDTNAIPLIVIPTTAGTGSEVTFFGVYSDWESNLKVTVASPYLAPTVAVVDPALTHSVPSYVTASSGIDVLAHAAETYVSRVSSPFSDAVALRAIELVSHSLRKAVFYGSDRTARNNMAEASFLAGIAFNHSFLGLTHAIAAAVSGHAHVPHGIAIGLLLPHVMDYNLPANEEKYLRIGQILAKSDGISVKETPHIVQGLARDIGIPQRLSEVGVTEEMLSGIAKQTLQSVQIQFNPRQITEEDALKLVRSVY